MNLLMVTWTDIFEGIGHCFQWIFGIMYKMGHVPNIFMGGFVVGLLAYWSFKLFKYKGEAQRNGTYQ